MATRRRMFIEGNEALALGALAAGCRFFAGYPITPATSLYSAMLQHLPPVGGVCLQGEDEIASIGFCLGASMAGMMAMTATSGPGISLMSEQISFAIAGEIPLVIVDVQRLGPSTGSATRGADGDIQFMRWGNSGGLPLVVLAPVDVVDCYRLAAQAFAFAERLRTPVLIASNKEVGMTRESIDPDAVALPVVTPRPPAAAAPPHLPFATQPGELVPRFLPMGGAIPVRQTSSTHGPEGFITSDPAVIGAGLLRLERKIEDQAADLALFDLHGPADAPTLVIAYGVTARAARSALGPDREAALLVLKTIWPLPEAAIRAAAEGRRRVLVVEMNLGQLVREIRRLLPGREVHFLGRMDGCLISPAEIAEKIAHG